MASSSTIEECDSSRTLPIPTGPVQSPKPGGAALNDLTNLQDSNSLPSGGNPSSNKASGTITTSSATTTITITASSTSSPTKGKGNGKGKGSQAQVPVSQAPAFTPFMGVPFIPPPVMGVPFVHTPFMGVPFVPPPLMGVPFIPPPVMGVPLSVAYSSLNVPALRDELRSRGLKVGGNKFELIARLQEFDLFAPWQEKTFIQQYEEKKLNRKDKYQRISEIPEQARSEDEETFIQQYEEKKLKKNEQDRQQYHDRKDKYQRISEIPEQARSEDEETFIQQYEEKKLKKHEQVRQWHHDRKDEYQRISKIPEQARFEDEETFIQQYEEKKLKKHEQDRQQYHDRKDKYQRISEIPEQARSEDEETFVQQYEEKRLSGNKRILQQYHDRKDKYQRISEIPEQARSEDERMFMYEYKHELELKSEYQKKRRREKGSLTIVEFEEESKKFTKNVALSCPDPSHAPSTTDMITRYLKNKHNEKNLEDIKKNFLARILFEGYNIYHFGICPIEDMQKILTDEEEELDVVIPYLQFSAQFTTLDHVDHLDPHRVIHQRGISAATSELYSWWLQRFLESIRVGLNHAFVRNNIQQLKGAKVYMFGKRAPEDEWGIRFTRAANHQLIHMHDFIVTRDPVIPDFVLEITFGATGFFDPHTTIDLIRINGQACDIRIWGPP